MAHVQFLFYRDSIGRVQEGINSKANTSDIYYPIQYPLLWNMSFSIHRCRRVRNHLIRNWDSQTSKFLKKSETFSARVSFLNISSRLVSEAPAKQIEFGSSGICTQILRAQRNAAPDTSSLAPEAPAKPARNREIRPSAPEWVSEASSLVPEAPAKQKGKFGTSATCKNNWELSSTLHQTHQVWRRRHQQKPAINL